MEAFKAFAQSNDWSLLLPELVLAGGAVLLLCREAFRKDDHSSGMGLPILIQGSLLLYVVLSYLSFDPNSDVTAFSGMIKQGFRADAMRAFFLCCTLLTTILATPFLKERNLPEAEFHAITSIAAAGMMLLAQSNHFLMLFVSLEMVAVCFYVLVGYHRGSAHSLEAGLKYLVFGAMSSAILLFGIVLIYGSAGNPAAWTALGGVAPDALSFDCVASFAHVHSDSIPLRLGVAFLLVGLAFKLGAVPFQAWVPDVYQGAPTPVTAFLSVASKGVGFVVLFNLVTGPLADLRDFLTPILSWVAALTILVGNLAALTQSNVKRLMGLSGVAHAGYLLVGIIAAMNPLIPEHRVFWAIVFYLLTYMLGSYLVFGVMGLVAGSNDTDQPRSRFSSLSQNRPFLAFSLVVGLGSLAGIPPFAGFIGKLLLFVVAFQAGLHGLFGIMVIGVVISIYYYFAWIREAVFPPLSALDEGVETRENSLKKKRPSTAIVFVLGLLAVATLVLGLYQGPVGEIFSF
jgi:NADH-quinone oxidoreductase subunit N